MATSVSYNQGSGNDVLTVNNGASMTRNSPYDSNLTVNDNAFITFSGTNPAVAALNIGDGGLATVATSSTPNATTLTTGSLFIDTTGKLDLTNNSMIINYGSGLSPNATAKVYLLRGFGPSGNWGGAAGITSSVAAATPGHRELGYADGADGVVSGLSTGQLLIKFTVTGDANLDGQTDSVDLGLLTESYGHSGKWDQGIVNIADLSMLAGNSGTSL